MSEAGCRKSDDCYSETKKNKLNIKSSDIHHRTSDKSIKNFKQIKWHKTT